MQSGRFLALLLLAAAVPVLARAQEQVPLRSLGSASLQSEAGSTTLGPANLVWQRSRPGHNAGDVHAGAALPEAGSPAGIPSPAPLQVKEPEPGFTGFAGLTHYDQRFAGSGQYANTQFSLEPSNAGLCVGNGTVMEVVNNALAVYDTTGNLLSGPVAFSQFWGLPPEIDRVKLRYGPFVSDPRCYFDSATRRWFVTELEIDTDPATGNFGNRSSVMIAVSKTSDPTGSYSIFSFDTTGGQGRQPGHPGCPCFGDQPLLGADANGLYISTNEFSTRAAGFNGAQIYAMSKSALAAGRRPTVVHINAGAIATPLADQANGAIWYSLQPATSPGAPASENDGTEYFLSALQFGPAPFDNRIAVWALTNTASLSNRTPSVQLIHAVVESESYGMAPGGFFADQKAGPAPLGSVYFPGYLEPLNANDDRMNQVVYAGGKLWAGVNTSVSVGGKEQIGIAWFAVEAGVAGSTLQAAIHSQGYVAVAGENAIFPSLAVNQAGQAVVGFTLVGPDYYPSAGYAPIGAQAGEVRVAAAGAAPDDGLTGYPPLDSADNGIARWGDYSAAVADEEGNLWIAAGYIGQSCAPAEFSADTTCGGTRSLLANWGTYIGKVPAQ